MKEETRLSRKKEIYFQMRKWLEEHGKVFPKKAISKRGKVLKSEQLTPRQRYEVTLARNWMKYSKEDADLFQEYMQLDIKDVPEEYRIIVEALRLKEEKPEEYDLRVKYKKEKNNVFEKIIKWLETHDGILPRSAITRNAKKVSRINMTKKELDEVHLYNKWIKSDERKVLEQYVGIPLEEIPKEYREYISKMREFGYGLKEENCFKEIIEWLNKNQGRLPRRNFKNKKTLSKEEKYEILLRKRWEKSEEKAILEKYIGKKISEIPKQHREKITILRSYGYGLTRVEIDEEIFKWIREHNGTLPRQVIRINDVAKKTHELSVEEHREIMLRNRWWDSEYRLILQEYIGRPIEEVPEKYREKIAFLRSYGLEREKIEYGNPYEEIIEWLKKHNGVFPKTVIHSSIKTGTKFVDGKEKRVKLSKYMTKEEHYEISLSHRWFRCLERQIFMEFQERPIEEVPEEYRSKIQKLREVVKSKSLRNIEKENEFFEEFIMWLEEHNNKPPRAKIHKKGKTLTRHELTEEELYENRLYSRWADSKIKSILDKYYGKPIEEIPEEYREKINELRQHGMIGRPTLKIMKNSVQKQVKNNSSTREELGEEKSKEDLRKKE